MSDRFTTYAKKRAAAVAVFFGLSLLLAISSVTDWAKSWPLVLFYAVLLLNTYFSVRSFASITPKEHIGQQLIDFALVACMLLLLINLNSALNFIALTTLLFIIATLKYIFLSEIAGYSKLMYMKIRIDALGILFCFLTLLAALWGYPRQASIVWALIFVLANFYVLHWNPHYDLENHYENSQ